MVAAFLVISVVAAIVPATAENLDELNMPLSTLASDDTCAGEECSLSLLQSKSLMKLRDVEGGATNRTLWGRRRRKNTCQSNRGCACASACYPPNGPGCPSGCGGDKCWQDKGCRCAPACYPPKGPGCPQGCRGGGSSNDGRRRQHQNSCHSKPGCACASACYPPNGPGCPSGCGGSKCWHDKGCSCAPACYPPNGPGCPKGCGIGGSNDGRRRQHQNSCHSNPGCACASACYPP